MCLLRSTVCWFLGFPLSNICRLSFLRLCMPLYAFFF
uniref:Uncharacterized protein n=1 Tax=Anguilla anguilla TaxID=7936 RepID=A0A0E9R100_ANGAN